MKIKTKELVKTLAEVAPGLAQKEIIEQSKCFIFQKGTVSTYNDKIAVTSNIDLDIEGAIEAEILYKLLTNIKDEEIEIFIENNELIIEGTVKDFATGLRISEVTIPLDAITPPKKFNPLPETFLDGIEICLMTVSNDMSRRTLTNLHFRNNIVESTDNFRYTNFDFKEDSFPKSLMIPAENIKELLKYKPTHYSINKSWIHFKMKSTTIYSCRIFDNESSPYPDTQKIIDSVSKDGEKLNMPSRVSEVLQTAGLFPSGDAFAQDKSVEITLEKNNMIIYGKGESGWFEEGLKVKYKGRKINFCINPEFLLQTLTLYNELIIGDTKVMLESDNSFHLVNMMQKREQ